MEIIDGNKLVINADGPEHRVALLENDILTEIHIERPKELGIVGNVYKGKVIRVLPGMQAAFVDIGIERTAFLHVADLITPSKESTLYLDELDEGRRSSIEDTGVEEPFFEPRIQDMLTEGQEVLVQVSKEPLGTKGARVTAHISLPGRNVVYMPTFQHIGISRRIADDSERKRLKDLAEALKKKDTDGFIIRTAAEGQSPAKLAADMDLLTKLWNQIKQKETKATAPSLLHADLDLILRSVRDMLSADTDICITDTNNEYEKIKEFVSSFMPRFTENIRRYEGVEPIFDALGVEPQIDRALQSRVWLKSGGYLIIEQTEALTAIDVNTGRFVGKRSLEETITKTNLEACREIADQLRLRNIGGIIIIDFIDMEKKSNRELVWRTLQERLARDRARCNLGPISGLGLVEMTRKRTRESLTRSLTETCSYCEGRGYLKSPQAISYEILRQLRREAIHCSVNQLVVNCHPTVAETLTQIEQESVDALENRLGKSILIHANTRLHIEHYEILYG